MHDASAHYRIRKLKADVCPTQKNIKRIIGLVLTKDQLAESGVGHTSYLPRTSRWVYKIKMAVDGQVEKLKARLVAWGFELEEGVDLPGDLCFYGQVGDNHVSDFYGYQKQMTNQAFRHLNGLFEWKFRLGGVHGIT